MQVSWLGLQPYEAVWEVQRTAASEVANGGEETLLAVEHYPVFTLGRGTQPEHLGQGREQLLAAGASVFDVDRGGSVTFHGPGQLVVYPIVRLAQHFPVPGHPSHGDVVAYVRALEGAIIDYVATLGVSAGRRAGYTGVWVGTSKLAAIGVKLSSGVTMHGLALNVHTDLSWFSRVVPCGIPDAGVVSLEDMGLTLTPRACYAALCESIDASISRKIAVK